MFVSSNTIAEIINYFKTSLADLYDEREIEEFVFLLSSHYFGWDKVTYRGKINANLSESELLKYHWDLKRLKKGEPIQYVIGKTYFYDLLFKVSEEVLIPRQETEELVHLILSEGAPKEIVLDIGTGSGCIPISLKKSKPNWKITGLDISEGALSLAHENALLNKVEVTFENVNILSCNSLQSYSPTLIVSNPPYITEKEKELMHRNVLMYEPEIALFVKNTDPLVFYFKIANLAYEALHVGGKLFFEINENFGIEVKNLLNSIGFNDIRLIKDLNNKDRIVQAIR